MIAVPGMSWVQPVGGVAGDDDAAAEAQLAQQLHQAALDVADARTAGDAVAEGKARERLAALSAAYLSRGKTDDALAAALAGGPSLLESLTTLTRNAAVLGVLVIALLLWAPWRR